MESIRPLWVGASDTKFSILAYDGVESQRAAMDVARRRSGFRRRKAIQIGCGEWHRGTVIPVLYESGYEIVLLVPNQRSVNLIERWPSYSLNIRKPPDGTIKTTRIGNYRALNMETQKARVIGEIATAEIVCCVHDPDITAFVKHIIKKAVRARDPRLNPRPLNVIFYHDHSNDPDPDGQVRHRHSLRLENSDLEEDSHEGHVDWGKSDGDLSQKMTVSNSLVDRFVLKARQSTPSGAGQPSPLDVSVEKYFDWHIEDIADDWPRPNLKGVIWTVESCKRSFRKEWILDVAYIIATSYGPQFGKQYCHDAMDVAEIEQTIRQATRETGRLIISRRHPEPGPLGLYRKRVLLRLKNRGLTTTGQHLILPRQETQVTRLLSVIELCFETNIPAKGLLKGLEMALRRLPDARDRGSQRLVQLMSSMSPKDMVTLECTKLAGAGRDKRFQTCVTEVFQSVREEMLSSDATSGPDPEPQAGAPDRSSGLVASTGRPSGSEKSLETQRGSPIGGDDAPERALERSSSRRTEATGRKNVGRGSQQAPALHRREGEASTSRPKGRASTSGKRGPTVIPAPVTRGARVATLSRADFPTSRSRPGPGPSAHRADSPAQGTGDRQPGCSCLPPVFGRARN